MGSPDPFRSSQGWNYDAERGQWINPRPSAPRTRRRLGNSWARLQMPIGVLAGQEDDLPVWPRIADPQVIHARLEEVQELARLQFIPATEARDIERGLRDDFGAAMGGSY